MFHAGAGWALAGPLLAAGSRSVPDSETLSFEDGTSGEVTTPEPETPTAAATGTHPDHREVVLARAPDVDGLSAVLAAMD